MEALFLKEWKSSAVLQGAAIREAVEVMNEVALQIALVVDPDDRLVGTVTDGDIRRGLLRGLSMDAPVGEVCNPSPLTVAQEKLPEEVADLMRRRQVRQIPVLDGEGRVVGLMVHEILCGVREHPNPVVLMAGGQGTRLRPLTEDCPKPMLCVGGKPILEIILRNFIKSGFSEFHISVNYMAEMIEDHFGDGSRWGVSINYLREKERSGTAGSLSLLPEGLEHPLIVMNGDLLTKVDYDNLLDFHAAQGAMATMCVREYTFQVPFGVVRFDGDRLLGLEEKPEHRFFVNAGIYVLDPALVARVPKGRYFEMTELFSTICERHGKAAIFPIREYWMDIGCHADLQQALTDYSEEFDQHLED